MHVGLKQAQLHGIMDGPRPPRNPAMFGKIFVLETLESGLACGDI
jgi:hypothetical protein